jgi:hypothetical protein
LQREGEARAKRLDIHGNSADHSKTAPNRGDRLRYDTKHAGGTVTYRNAWWGTRGEKEEK